MKGNGTSFMIEKILPRAEIQFGTARSAGHQFMLTFAAAQDDIILQFFHDFMEFQIPKTLDNVYSVYVSSLTTNALNTNDSYPVLSEMKVKKLSAQVNCTYILL